MTLFVHFVYTTAIPTYSIKYSLLLVCVLFFNEFVQCTAILGNDCSARYRFLYNDDYDSDLYSLPRTALAQAGLSSLSVSLLMY